MYFSSSLLSPGAPQPLESRVENDRFFIDYRNFSRRAAIPRLCCWGLLEIYSSQLAFPQKERVLKRMKKTKAWKTT
jgi:hypothetical protein